MKKETQHQVVFFYIVFLGILFSLFQNFSVPIKDLDKKFIYIEKTEQGKMRFIFEGDRAKAILSKLTPLESKMVNWHYKSTTASATKPTRNIVYHGHQLSCMLQPQGKTPTLCWTILNKDGFFERDDQLPTLSNKKYFPVRMPVIDHESKEVDVVKALEKHKINELKLKDEFEVQVKLENSFFGQNSLPLDVLAKNDSSKDMFCSPLKNELRHECKFKINKLGKIMAGNRKL